MKYLLLSVLLLSGCATPELRAPNQTQVDLTQRDPIPDRMLVYVQRVPRDKVPAVCNVDRATACISGLGTEDPTIIWSDRWGLLHEIQHIVFGDEHL